MLIIVAVDSSSIQFESTQGLKQNKITHVQLFSLGSRITLFLDGREDVRFNIGSSSRRIGSADIILGYPLNNGVVALADIGDLKMGDTNFQSCHQWE